MRRTDRTNRKGGGNGEVREKEGEQYVRKG